MEQCVVLVGNALGKSGGPVVDNGVVVARPLGSLWKSAANAGMRYRASMRWPSRLLGNPTRLGVSGLRRGVGHGREAYSVRCFRQLGERGDASVVGFAVPFFTSESAGIRRAAAACVGHLGNPDGRDACLRGLAVERTESGALAFAVAAVRCGAGAEGVAAGLAARSARKVSTHTGARAPLSAAAVMPMEEIFWANLVMPGAPRSSGAVCPRDELRQHYLATMRGCDLGSEPFDVQKDALWRLGFLQHPDDTAVLLAAEHTLGRRAGHDWLLALGRTGDPLVIPALLAALRARDIDPARGFTQRRLAAIGLGVAGLREWAPALIAALADEKHDFEGRPGAGLGIQFPVRSAIYWALGEIGDPRAIPSLISVLDDTHGSAFGGFYLPAVDALFKIGPAAIPALRAVLRSGTEVAHANAAGALSAIEGWPR